MAGRTRRGRESHMVKQQQLMVMMMRLQFEGEADKEKRHHHKKASDKGSDH